MAKRKRGCAAVKGHARRRTTKAKLGTVRKIKGKRYQVRKVFGKKRWVRVSATCGVRRKGRKGGRRRSVVMPKSKRVRLTKAERRILRGLKSKAARSLYRKAGLKFKFPKRLRRKLMFKFPKRLRRKLKSRRLTAPRRVHIRSWSWPSTSSRRMGNRGSRG